MGGGEVKSSVGMTDLDYLDLSDEVGALRVLAREQFAVRGPDNIEAGISTIEIVTVENI
jgi:hypothetical protein